MRRRITWLVAATSSALVVAFVLPLSLLLLSVAEDRAAARARDQAQSVAAVVGTVEDAATLRRAIETLSAAGPPVVLVTPDGSMVGAGGSLRADTAAAVDRARTTLQASTVRQDHGIDAVVPVARADLIDVVVATVPEDEVRAGLVTGWLALAALGVALVGAAVLLARELGRRVSEPVTELGRVAHRLGEGDLSARAVPAGPEETVEVARTLNRLAERIDGLLVAERERVADLAHRLRTPVTALRLATDQLADHEAAARLDGILDELDDGITGVVHEARQQVVEALPQPSDLAAEIGERTTFWRALAEDQGRPVTLSLPPDAVPLPVPLSPRDLRELFDTLIDNYFSHTPEGAPLAVTVGGDATHAWFDVSDGGPGLGRPYGGRGDSGAGSTGLGLDIVRRTADAAGGRVELGASTLGGLSVRVVLPLRR